MMPISECNHKANPNTWTDFITLYAYEMPTTINKAALETEGYATMKVIQMEARRCKQCGKLYRAKVNTYQKKLNPTEITEIEAQRKAKANAKKLAKQTLLKRE
jgi:hypothetical protein